MQKEGIIIKKTVKKEAKESTQNDRVIKRYSEVLKI